MQGGYCRPPTPPPPAGLPRAAVPRGRAAAAWGAGAGTPRMPDTGVMTRIDAAAGAPPAVIAGQRVELLDRARVYGCGIAPYDVTHLGHAATFVWVDTLGRTLRFFGVDPDVCRNVTDVDDVLDAAAHRAGAAYDSFAAIQQFQFDRDMAALNVRAPEHEPRAHRDVGPVIRLAAGLLDGGAAYGREGCG